MLLPTQTLLIPPHATAGIVRTNPDGRAFVARISGSDLPLDVARLCTTQTVITMISSTTWRKTNCDPMKRTSS